MLGSFSVFVQICVFLIKNRGGVGIPQLKYYVQVEVYMYYVRGISSHDLGTDRAAGVYPETPLWK